MDLFRRGRIALAVGTIIVLLSGTSIANAQVTEESVHITWRVPRDEVPTIRDALPQNGGTITPDYDTMDDTRGLPLIYVVAGIVALPSLVSAVSMAVRDVWCGGALIEATDDGLAITCEPTLGVGTVVVHDKNGIKVQHFGNVQEPGPLVEALGKLMGESKK